jgi:hypothetical protein
LIRVDHAGVQVELLCPVPKKKASKIKKVNGKHAYAFVIYIGAKHISMLYRYIIIIIIIIIT